MDIQAYITSGILEEYCLGLLNEEEQANLIKMSILYPEIKDELIAVEIALEQLAQSGAIEPGLGVRQRILNMFGVKDTDEPVNPDQFPAIGRDTDYQTWLNKLEDLIPDEPTESLSIEIIRDDEYFKQMLVISKQDIPEEEHGEFLESFLILKGRCECTVGDSLHTLGVGDFIEIPLHTKHDVKILTPHVVAVLQYEFIS
jgi:mannose-6-phosphate isomerase-like protein (cupin superfamily)